MELLDDNFRSDKHLRTIEDLVENGYQTDVYRYIREGWELFKKNAGQFIIYTVLVMLISAALSRVKLGYIANIIIGPCLSAGWYLVIRKVSFNEVTEFKDFFDGFKHWKKVVPFYIVAKIFTFIRFVFLVLPGIYLAVCYLFILPIILFYRQDLEMMDVLEGSRKVITKKWWNFLGLLGLLVLVNIAGALALGVGSIVSIPVSVCALYVAYEDIFGVSVENDPINPV